MTTLVRHAEILNNVNDAGEIEASRDVPYQTLRAMERLGLVEIQTRWEYPLHGTRRPYKLARITDAGRAARNEANGGQAGQARPTPAEQDRPGPASQRHAVTATVTEVPNIPKLSPDGDRQARWRPSSEQVAAALALLRAPGLGHDMIVVPIANPGKAYGIWATGQHVAHPAGLFPCDRDGYGRARDAASDAAKAWLLARGGPGTFSYCRIELDTWTPQGWSFAVFEDGAIR